MRHSHRYASYDSLATPKPYEALVIYIPFHATMKGFSPRNLKYMRAFAEAYPQEQFVQQVLAQITWYHHITLLEKVKDEKERLWYIQQAAQHGWSRNVLVMQIETGVFQRTGKALTNFKLTSSEY